MKIVKIEEQKFKELIGDLDYLHDLTYRIDGLKKTDNSSIKFMHNKIKELIMKMEELIK